MKGNSSFESNRCLAAGLGLNAACLCATNLIEIRHPLTLFLLGFMESLSLILMLFGLLRATPKGRVLLAQVCRFKRSLFGKGDA